MKSSAQAPEGQVSIEVDGYDLFDKTELAITGIALVNANLDQVARVAAGVFGIDRGDLLVTDVQGDCLVIDILRKGMDPHAFMGKKEELLRRLSAIPGIEITEPTTISSRGMLGWIALGGAEGEEVLKRSEEMAAEIRRKLNKTAVVFSTGAEMVCGQVEDTNEPTIRRRLQPEGYAVKTGPTLRDDETLIAAHLRQAADDGYGLVVITGGVGAEDKDRTIEAVLMADPGAGTKDIVKFELGVGRHRHKDSVRIAVGKISGTLVVALPGPNDEVQVGMNRLVEGLKANMGKEDLAEFIAGGLRGRIKQIHTRG